MECERSATDLLVWTNARLIRWLEQVDLAEYTGQLQESALHGALAVLDGSFSSDTLAQLMGIPAGRHMVRKHLAAEFATLLFEARYGRLDRISDASLICLSEEPSLASS